MTPAPLPLWIAANVHRWHGNPSHRLRNSGDTNAAHKARMLILRRVFWPDMAELDDPILAHDLPEFWSIDLRADLKRAWPELRYALDKVDDLILEAIGWGKVPAAHAEALLFLDRLDAFLWMLAVDPEQAGRDGWPEARRWLYMTAEAYAIADLFAQVVAEVEATA